VAERLYDALAVLKLAVQFKCEQGADVEAQVNAALTAWRELTETA
jgi:hypothetical protein